jgi:hypothetical protein
MAKLPLLNLPDRSLVVWIEPIPLRYGRSIEIIKIGTCHAISWQRAQIGDQ